MQRSHFVGFHLQKYNIKHNEFNEQITLVVVLFEFFFLVCTVCVHFGLFFLIWLCCRQWNVCLVQLRTEWWRSCHLRDGHLNCVDSKDFVAHPFQNGKIAFELFYGFLKMICSQCDCTQIFASQFIDQIWKEIWHIFKMFFFFLCSK